MYDAFISYNRADSEAAKPLNSGLKELGIKTYFDTDELLGEVFLRRAADVLKSVPAAIIAIGKHGTGRTQQQEIEVCIQEHSKRDLRIIPVLLAGASESIIDNPFVQRHTWTRLDTPSSLMRLACAIKGVNPLEQSSKLVEDEIKERASTEATHPFIDAYETAVLKERMHNIAMCIAQCASNQADVVGEQSDNEQIARVIPMIVDFKWSRSYLSGLNRMLSAYAPENRLKSYNLVKTKPACRLKDGVVSATAKDDVITIFLDNIPAATISVPDAERPAVMAALNSHGRLGAPGADGGSLLERLGEIPVTTAKSSPLVEAFRNNLEALAPLVARFGIRYAKWLLNEDKVRLGRLGINQLDAEAEFAGVERLSEIMKALHQSK